MPLRLLTLAPSTTYPPMIGDAKRIYRLARGFWQNGLANTYVGRTFVQTSDEEIEFPALQQVKEVNRTWNGIKAWLLRGHYNEVKQCTPRWRAFVEPYLSSSKFDAVYLHFLFSYPLLADLLRDRVFVIDTHNSEWGWYKSFRDSSRNPMIKQVCDASMRRATQIMAMLPSHTIMAHVAQADAEAYRAVRPDLMHLVVPNGGDIQLRATSPDYTSPRKKLLFFGSLHGKMSLDAMKHFEDHFWPTLQDLCHVIVAGANPSTGIQKMVARQGWELRSNLTEAQVDQVFAESHYSIMPFTYGEGSKLKFFDACARGVPILTTTSGACGQSDVPSLVTIANEPREWRETILKRTCLEEGWEEEIEGFCRKFTWKTIAASLIPVLEQAQTDRSKHR